MKYYFILFFLFCVLALKAQTDIDLLLNHKYNGTPFSYTDIYSDNQGRSVSISRLQYYLSSINITHDGGQNTSLTGTYVLTRGNVSTYSLGSYPFSSVEAIQFDLGVDYNANHGNTSNYPSSHPLGPQTPLMDWSWPAGYFFLVIEGMVDEDNDGLPEKPWSAQALGDIMLQNVSPISVIGNQSTSKITIPLDVHIDRWLTSVDLANIGIDHSSSAGNQQICSNTITYNVFSAAQSTVSINNNSSDYISIDYTMPYAPVINYKLDGSNRYYDLTITDMQGREIVFEKDLNFEGNYFVKQELKTGVYFATFTSDSFLLTEKFSVKR